MAQTLTALSAPSNPAVIADSKKQVGNMAALENLGRADLLTIAILGEVHTLYATRDYRTNHKQLITDAVGFWGAVSLLTLNDVTKQVLLAMASSMWNLGFKTDPVSGVNTTGISSDVNTVVAEGKDLRTLPEETLSRILLYLQVYLSV